MKKDQKDQNYPEVKTSLFYQTIAFLVKISILIIAQFVITNGFGNESSLARPMSMGAVPASSGGNDVRTAPVFSNSRTPQGHQTSSSFQKDEIKKRLQKV